LLELLSEHNDDTKKARRTFTCLDVGDAI